jgi:3-keto-5-aminohexanoate cleavage enzyme
VSDPVIVQCAVTGSIGAAGASPHLPVTPGAIADAAIEAWRAGASVIHVHAREEDGTPTQSLDRYREIVERIRSSDCDAVLNLSTGSAGNRAHGAERYACLALRPELASFDCGSTNFGDWVFENSPSFLRDLAAAIAAAGAAPEIECFDASHVVAALQLHADGHLAAPLRFQFVLGVRGGAPATLEQAIYMRSLLPAGSRWSICAIGRHQLPMNAFSLIAGGHVRTGLEDNLYYARGRLATGNAELVARAVRLAGELGRPVATPAQARELLALGGAAA